MAVPSDESASAGAGRPRGFQPGNAIGVATRFQPKNDAALTHGGRSEGKAALQAPLRAAKRAQVLADLGADEDTLSATLLELVDRFAETSLLCSAYFTWLEDQGGPIGTKGRQRAAVKGYLAALDRQIKLATLIGLARKAKPVEDAFSIVREYDRREAERQRAADTECQMADDSAATGDDD